MDEGARRPCAIEAGIAIGLLGWFMQRENVWWDLNPEINDLDR